MCEALRLLLGVVDLRECIAELDTAGEVLEALHERRVVVRCPRERRQLDRVVVENRRLDERRLDEPRVRVVNELRPRRIVRDVDVSFPEPAAQVALVAGPEPLLLERVDELHSSPRRGEVDLLPLEGRLRRPEHVLRGTRDELLDPGHRVAVVGVRLVPLEHRELGVMLERDSLVAEVLADLVDLLEPADDQPLEVELGGDAEIAILVELVVVRHERLGERAAVARLEHGRLDLDEPPLVQDAPDRRDCARAKQRFSARFFVHQEVEVSLAIPQLDVRQAVECVGQRRRDARQHLERVHEERGLAAARLRRRADDADDVAEVDVDLAGALHGAQELDPPRAVDEIEEDELPHVAPREHAAGETTRRLGLGSVFERLRLGENRGDLVAVGKALRRGHPRESIDPRSPSRSGSRRPTSLRRAARKEPAYATSERDATSSRRARA